MYNRNRIRLCAVGPRTVRKEFSRPRWSSYQPVHPQPNGRQIGGRWVSSVHETNDNGNEEEEDFDDDEDDDNDDDDTERCDS